MQAPSSMRYIPAVIEGTNDIYQSTQPTAKDLVPLFHVLAECVIRLVTIGLL